MIATEEETECGEKVAGYLGGDVMEIV